MLLKAEGVTATNGCKAGTTASVTLLSLLDEEKKTVFESWSPGNIGLSILLVDHAIVGVAAGASEDISRKPARHKMCGFIGPPLHQHFNSLLYFDTI